jgi:GH24 family phage-related lysozyme (muramidase)
VSFFVPTAQMVADMRRREGYSAEVYKDSKGLPTQGIGRHTGVKFGDPPIDDATAARWLAEDLQRGYAGAASLFRNLDAIDVVRREALIDVTFNMGRDKLAQFTPFIGYVNAGKWASAMHHLLVNTKGHLTPYLLQVGQRGIEIGGRIATGEVLEEHRI